MKVLITGTNGFIGGQLKKHFDNPYELNEDTLVTEQWLNENKPEAVFHVGACSNTMETDVNYIMNVNYESTRLIADWCYNNRIPLIYSSSAACYGTNNLHPSNLYGWSKYVGEHYVVGRGGIALRYFNVYGPGELVHSHMAAVIGLWRGMIEKGEPIIIHGDGEQRRDFTHIDDIVNGLYLISQSDITKEDAWELGTGKNYSLNQVAEMFGDVEKKYVPDVKGNYRETLRKIGRAHV